MKFIALFTNDYDAAVLSDPDAFIETFQREFCDDTGIRCSRLLRPMNPDDVEEVTETTSKYLIYLDLFYLVLPVDQQVSTAQYVSLITQESPPA